MLTRFDTNKQNFSLIPRIYPERHYIYQRFLRHLREKHLEGLYLAHKRIIDLKIKLVNQTLLKIFLLTLFGVLLLPAILFAQKNDTVYLSNGDRITGELKKYEYGLLTFKTDAMNTVIIEYDLIQTMYSSKYFMVRTSSGMLYFGSIAKADFPGSINLVITNDTILKPIVDIVQITSIKNKIWSRIDGAIDLGSSYTKASDVLQFNLSGNASYRTARYFSDLNMNSIITSQSTKNTSRKNDAELGINRILQRRWFAGVQAKGQQNTELNLEYRIQTGLGLGYDMVHNNRNRLFSTAGIFVNNEKTIDTEKRTTNIEGLVAVSYKWFKYQSPKIDVVSSASLYPSFTVAGRYRFEYELKAKFEIITDLYLSLSLYDNYDSKPSETDPAKNDWGVITSIGYSF